MSRDYRPDAAAEYALARDRESRSSDFDLAGAEQIKPIGSCNGGAIIVRLSDVKPEPVEWLWSGRFALGKLTLIAGDPGLGKSLVSLDMAARVSTGSSWPDRPGEGSTPGGVVLLSAEDDVADTIRPRLDAAGADVSRIAALIAIKALGDNEREWERSFDLSRDLPALESAIRSVEGCRLVVIDPVTAYLGGTDSHKNGEIRGLLAPLAALAAAHRVAVVAVTHLNKSGMGQAIYRAMGSLAFVAAARAVWSVSKDKDDPDGPRRLMLSIKNNLAPDRGGLAYRVEPLGADGSPAVSWEPEPVYVSADDALSGDRNDAGGGAESEQRRLLEWIERKGGTVTARDLTHGLRKYRGDPEAAERDLEALVKAGIGEWEWPPPGPKGGPPSKRFRLVLTVTVTATPPDGPTSAGNGDGDTGNTATDAGDGWGEVGP